MEQDSKKYYDMQKKLRDGTPILNCDREDINYIQKPLGRANFINGENRSDNSYFNEPEEKIKKHPKDPIYCELCNCSVIRRNLGIHKKSKKHKMYMNMNKKLRELLI